jgi:hypothetical protein
MQADGSSPVPSSRIVRRDASLASTPEAEMMPPRIRSRRSIESRRVRNGLVFLLLASAPWVLFVAFVARGALPAALILAQYVVAFAMIECLWRSPADPGE